MVYPRIQCDKYYSLILLCRVLEDRNQEPMVRHEVQCILLLAIRIGHIINIHFLRCQNRQYTYSTTNNFYFGVTILYIIRWKLTFKGPVTRCNLSCNLQHNSAFETCKLVKTVWSKAKPGHSYCTLAKPNCKWDNFLFQAGEALGAIGSPEVIDVLTRFLKDDQIEVKCFVYDALKPRSTGVVDQPL